MINVLCDTALVYGFANDKKTVSDQIVTDVIADKQQYSIFPCQTGVPGSLSSCNPLSFQLRDIAVTLFPATTAQGR